MNKDLSMVSRDRDASHNTALELAVINGASLELLECLLSPPGVDVNSLNLDVNALNNEGITTLDIAQDKPNCADIVKKLEAAGATVNTHMVVASLIATVTFAAMFTVPGGIEDDKESIHYGAAKLALRKPFRLFLFSDTVAFTTSLTMVFAWLYLQQLKSIHSHRSVMDMVSNMSKASLVISIFWTSVAFVTATLIVVMPHNLDSLKIKDEKAFSTYKLLYRSEIILAVITPIFVGGLLPALFEKSNIANNMMERMTIIVSVAPHYPCSCLYLVMSELLCFLFSMGNIAGRAGGPLILSVYLNFHIYRWS